MEGTEECDNGQEAGCPVCKVDTLNGWSCDSASPSSCYLCGNSVRDPTEECDNGNNTGCINCIKAANGIATEIQAAFLPATNAATANENSAKAVIIGISQGAFLAR